MSNIEDNTMMTIQPNPSYDEIICYIYKRIHEAHLLKQKYKENNKLDFYYQMNGAINVLICLLTDITEDNLETIQNKIQKLIKECEKNVD